MDGKNLSYDCIDLPFPLVRRLQVYDHFLWSEPGDNLDEIDSRFTLEQQRLAEEVKKQVITYMELEIIQFECLSSALGNLKKIIQSYFFYFFLENQTDRGETLNN